ncbi:adenosine deaminase [Legionella massiliensis]|uniref:adenosine deaminase n=1 Tax=Legionella massiliensis TaxID=1034943 RepID=A0A078KUT7_9GAMM|nr:adenosine deaminase [Legionella massiliensis]CDZ76767.1 adenosine deaminase [Legionella massiliensis]CEE12505.1 Aminodeoxyfutalosine deaminase [Legionella massiliensis]
MRLLKLFALLLLPTYQVFADSTTAVSNYFNSIKTRPNALYAFLKEMPKGGELHYHLAGGAYPETMLALAAKGDYCLDKQTFVMSKKVERCIGISASELTETPLLYKQTIRAWSLQDFVAGQESSDEHFFATFFKFMRVLADYRPELLTEIMQRAANQHELYLEVMMLPDNAKSTNFAPKELNQDNFAAARKDLLANKDFSNNIQFTVDETKRILQQARKNLGCETAPQQEVCNLTVKFQYYVLREQPLEKVFAQALNGFAAAANSQDLVSVNLVQAEDGIISLRDYHKQMQVFKFLHQNYPNVHISLHAGELAPGRVVPENLRFHIQDAILTGQAERIGHGVDISYEDKAEKLLQQMASDKIAVEINLISNKKILNISGAQHPLNEYLLHRVPVVLSTDDEGVLRTDLTRQYVEAALNHHLDYPTLKMISRNALTYSFLPGKSLWLNADEATPQNACQNLNSPSCLQFVNENEKAKLQRQLELELDKFESSYAASS